MQDGPATYKSRLNVEDLVELGDAALVESWLAATDSLNQAQADLAAIEVAIEILMAENEATVIPHDRLDITYEPRRVVAKDRLRDVLVRALRERDMDPDEYLTKQKEAPPRELNMTKVRGLRKLGRPFTTLIDEATSEEPAQLRIGFNRANKPYIERPRSPLASEE